MSTKARIKSAAVISYFVIIFNIVAGLLYTPWMISVIGKESYGLYVLVTSFLAYFTVDYGLYQAISKHIAEAHVKEDFELEKRIIGVSSTLYLLIDCAIAIVLLIMYFQIDNIYANLPHDQLMLFKQLYVVASVFAVLNFPFISLKGVFMGKEFFVSTKLFDLAKRTGVILLTVILLLLNYNVKALVYAYGIVPFAICILEVWYLYRNNVRIKLFHFDKHIAKSITFLSIWLLLVVVGELFTTNIAPTMIAIYSSATQIAVFSIGLALYGYVYSFAGAINGLFLPKVLRMKESGHDEEINSQSTIVSAIQLMVVGLFFIGICLVGQEFIHLWVGKDFNDSYYVGCMLIAPQLILLCQPIESTELFASNKLKYRSFLTLATAVSTVVLSLFLCPRFGAIGMAAAISASMFALLGIGINVVYAKVLKRPRVPFIKLFIRYLLSFLLIGIIYFFAIKIVPSEHNWLIFAIRVIMLTVIYLAIMLTVGMPRLARNMILKPIIKKLC